mgnify:CR=1 FL=1
MHSLNEMEDSKEVTLANHNSSRIDRLGLKILMTKSSEDDELIFFVRFNDITIHIYL